MPGLMDGLPNHLLSPDGTVNKLLSPHQRYRQTNGLMAAQFDREPTPYFAGYDQPLTERAGILPLGQYADGQVRAAWPGLLAGPVEAANRLWGEMSKPGVQSVRDNPRIAEDAFEFAGGAATGSLLAPRPANSLGTVSRIAPAQPQQRAIDDLGYYSQGLESARALKQAKGTPEQMLAQLRSAGVKQAEIEATNLPAYMEGKKSITRDEIVAHLEANRVGLMEKFYGLNMDAASVAARAELAAIKKRIQEIPSGTRENPNPEYDRLNDRRFELGQIIKDKPTKWSSYSLDPSNPTYRETVLHLPGENPRIKALVDARNALRESKYTDPARSDLPGFAEGRNVRDQLAAIDSEKSSIPDAFSSGHFPEPNIVGHMMTSMTKHEGQPVYTIDQIQSDWGQKLRDGGVRDEAKIAELRKRVAETDPDTIAIEAAEWVGKNIPEHKRLGELTADEMADLLNKEMSGKGYLDEDAVPPALLDLSSRLEKAVRENRMLVAELRTAEASTPGHPLVNTTDQWVNTTLRRGLKQAVDANAEYMAIPSGNTVLGYNPGDTAGMQAFYDKIVPKNLGNMLMKADPSVARSYVDTLETPSNVAAGRGFSMFPITPQVREYVNNGLPLFANPLPSSASGLLGQFRGDDEYSQPNKLLRY